MTASKVARDPELAARLMMVMSKSCPPSCFQFVISPVKILRSCSVVRLSTETSLLVITAMPATAT